MMFAGISRRNWFFLALSVLSLPLLMAPTLAEYGLFLYVATDAECSVSHRVDDPYQLLDVLEVRGAINQETGQCFVKIEATLHVPSPVTGFGVEIVEGTARVRGLDFLVGGSGNDDVSAPLAQMELTLVDSPGAESHLGTLGMETFGFVSPR